MPADQTSDIIEHFLFGHRSCWNKFICSYKKNVCRFYRRREQIVNAHIVVFEQLQSPNKKANTLKQKLKKLAM